MNGAPSYTDLRSLWVLDHVLLDLKTDEGTRRRLYIDSTGKTTIGIGRNLTDGGITVDEADYMCRNDIRGVMVDLDHNIPWWKDLSQDRRRALVNMCFALGWPRLSEFIHMLAALRDGYWDQAAQEVLNSKWAGQVGDRAKRIAALFVSG